jgi:hypothetical protein
MPFVDNQGAKIYWDAQGTGPPIFVDYGPGLPLRHVAPHPTGAGGFLPNDRPRQSRSWRERCAPRPLLDGSHGFGRSRRARRRRRSLCSCLWCIDGRHDCPEFALQYPRRVQSLILGCTSAGGWNAKRAEPAAVEMLKAASQVSREQESESAIPFLYDPATPRHLIDEDIAGRRARPTNPAGYFAQLQAVLGWESFSRLPRITAPTLVIHGKADRLVPPGNGELIAARIPGAQLVLLERASHLFSTDQPEAAQRAISELLAVQPVGANAGEKRL